MGHHWWLCCGVPSFCHAPHIGSFLWSDHDEPNNILKKGEKRFFFFAEFYVIEIKEVF